MVLLRLSPRRDRAAIRPRPPFFLMVLHTARAGGLIHAGGYITTTSWMHRAPLTAYDNDGLLTGSGPLAVTRSAQDGLITSTKLGLATDTRTYNSFGEQIGRASCRERWELVVIMDVLEKE